VPAREETAQYVFTAVGWNTTQDASTNDIHVRLNVTSDRIVYAAYSRATKAYTITWMSNGTVLRTDTNVRYGTKPNWGTSMPKDEYGRTAIRWDYNVNTGITGDTIINAKYIPEYTATFVLAAVDSDTESQKTLYSYKLDQETVPVYGGKPPVSIQGNSTDFKFIGWSP